MFTGLVETTGSVSSFRRAGEVFRLAVKAPAIASELILGQSVAVSGACLSVTSVTGDTFEVDMMPETAERTWFGSRMKPGVSVNLERALRVGDRLDGHMVLGHVDGTAVLRELSGGRTREALFSAPPSLTRGIVPKGSVAIDGVSLTVINVTDSSFSVGLIPTTLDSCTLGGLGVGGTVNIETDILGKYVERLLSAQIGVQTRRTDPRDAASNLSIEELIKLGF